MHFKKISYIKMIIFFALYIFLIMVYSLKTIYYYADNPLWWIYVCLISIIFVYFIYYCWLNKSHVIRLLVFFSVFLACMPFEYELPRLISLIRGDENLSGFGEMIPLRILGILFDILCYPVLNFILLFFSMKIAYVRKYEDK